MQGRLQALVAKGKGRSGLQQLLELSLELRQLERSAVGSELLRGVLGPG